METKQFLLTAVFFAALNSVGAFAAPFILTENGSAGTSDEGLGMSLSEMRSQLDRYWAAGEITKFFVAGKELSFALKQRETLYDSITARDYIDTSLYVLGHSSTSDSVPYAAIALASKAEIGRMLLGGDYIYYYFGGADYQKVRTDLVEAGISLMNAMRTEQSAKPIVLVERTSDPRKPGLSEEQKAAALKLRQEQDWLRLAGSMAIICRKHIPEAIERIEKKFVGFLEQEYRRFPPEKGEMENIIARAGLPKEASERLRLLIAR